MKVLYYFLIFLFQIFFSKEKKDKAGINNGYHIQKQGNYPKTILYFIMQ